MSLINRSQLLMTISILSSVVASLSGCGLSNIANRETNPTIQDTFDHWPWPFTARAVNTFSTTASRRVVIVSVNHRNSAMGVEDLLICAEPPPDIGEAFASALASELKAAVKEPKSGITGELSGQYGRAVSTQIAPLLYRTQGLQFLRDGLHSLCIDKMNGWIEDQLPANPSPITNSNYREVKTLLINKAAQLILEELPRMAQTQTEFYKHVKAGIAPEELKAIADIVKPVPAATTTTTTSTPSATTTTTSPNK